eukprot:11915294-Alexandrium_andersonii.AAC.1
MHTRTRTHTFPHDAGPTSYDGGRATDGGGMPGMHQELASLDVQYEYTGKEKDRTTLVPPVDSAACERDSKEKRALMCKGKSAAFECIQS